MQYLNHVANPIDFTIINTTLSLE